MARYKDYFYEQQKLLPVRYAEQILPVTFEHTLHHAIDDLDLTVFDARYRNDEGGAALHTEFLIGPSRIDFGSFYTSYACYPRKLIRRFARDAPTARRGSPVTSK